MTKANKAKSSLIVLATASVVASLLMVVAMFQMAVTHSYIDNIKTVICCSFLGIFVWLLVRAQQYVINVTSNEPEGDHGISVDYTNIFTIFAFLFFGTTGGLIMSVFENASSIMSMVESKAYAKNKFELCISNVINSTASIVVAFMINTVMYLTPYGENHYYLIAIVAVIFLADIINMFIAIIAMDLVARARNNGISNCDRLDIVHEMSSNYMYYIYIMLGPIVLYLVSLQWGIAGFITFLIILVPSQHVGLLYMRLKHTQDRLFTDELTGSYNSMKFRVDMDEQFKTGKPYSLIMFDLDKFKSINDTYGHDAGDDALKAFSKLLGDIQEKYKEICVAYRVHGDEYTMLIRDTSKTENIVKELNGACKEFYLNMKTKTIQLKFSGGATDILPETPVREALTKADQVLYEVKNEGRGFVKYRSGFENIEEVS